MTNHNAAHEVAQADPYDVLVDSIADGSLELPSEFTLHPWYPGGAQITGTTVEILVTDYNDPGMFDVGVYAMPNDGDDDPIAFDTVDSDDLLEHLHDLFEQFKPDPFATAPDAADRIAPPSPR